MEAGRQAGRQAASSLAEAFAADKSHKHVKKEAQPALKTQDYQISARCRGEAANMVGRAWWAKHGAASVVPSKAFKVLKIPIKVVHPLLLLSIAGLVITGCHALPKSTSSASGKGGVGRSVLRTYCTVHALRTANSKIPCQQQKGTSPLRLSCFGLTV